MVRSFIAVTLMELIVFHNVSRYQYAMGLKVKLHVDGVV